MIIDKHLIIIWSMRRISTTTMVVFHKKHLIIAYDIYWNLLDRLSHRQFIRQRFAWVLYRKRETISCFAIIWWLATNRCIESDIKNISIVKKRINFGPQISLINKTFVWEVCTQDINRYPVSWEKLCFDNHCLNLYQLSGKKSLKI